MPDPSGPGRPGPGRGSASAGSDPAPEAPSPPSPDEARGIFRPGGTLALLSPRVLDSFRLILTLLTLAMVAWYLRSRPSMDFSGFRLDPGPLALGLLLAPALLWMRALKWRWLLRGLAPRVTFGESLRSYLGSMALAMATPGRVGELSRGLYLPHPAVQGWKGAGLVLVDSWTDFLAVAAWACLGFHRVWGTAGLLWGLLLAALVSPIPLWLRLVPPVLSRLPSRWGFRAWAARALPAPGDVPPRDLLAAGLLGIAAYGLEWVQMACLLEGISSAEPSALRLAGVMALVALANTVQVTMGGFGVREGMAILLLAGEGVGPEAAAAAAFLQSILLLMVPALLGLAVKPAVGPGVRAPAAPDVPRGG